MVFQTAFLFAGTALIFSLLPGPAVLQVSGQAIAGGFRAAAMAILGIELANAIYFALPILGFGALILASAAAFTVLRIVGAAYLVGLGLYALWSAKGDGAPPPPGRPFRQGLLIQLGNPKAILFLGAFLPQFLDAHRPLLPQYAQMVAICMPMEGVVLGGYALLASHGARLIGGARAGLWRTRVSGVVFIIIGLLFATARRA